MRDITGMTSTLSGVGGGHAFGARRFHWVTASLGFAAEPRQAKAE